MVSVGFNQHQLLYHEVWTERDTLWKGHLIIWFHLLRSLFPEECLLWGPFLHTLTVQQMVTHCKLVVWELLKSAWIIEKEPGGWWRWENPFREVMMFGLSFGNMEGYGMAIWKASTSKKAPRGTVFVGAAEDDTCRDMTRWGAGEAGVAVPWGPICSIISMESLWSSAREHVSGQFTEESDCLDMHEVKWRNASESEQIRTR